MANLKDTGEDQLNTGSRLRMLFKYFKFEELINHSDMDIEWEIEIMCL